MRRPWLQRAAQRAEHVRPQLVERAHRPRRGALEPPRGSRSGRSPESSAITGAKTTLHSVADHGASYRSRNSETGHARSIAGLHYVYHRRTAAGLGAARIVRPKVLATSQALAGRQHYADKASRPRRRRAFKMARPARVRCAGGSRASWHAFGCSAGKSACSRENSTTFWGMGKSADSRYALTGAPVKSHISRWCTAPKRYRLPHQRMLRWNDTPPTSDDELGNGVSTRCAQCCGEGAAR